MEITSAAVAAVLLAALLTMLGLAYKRSRKVKYLRELTARLLKYERVAFRACLNIQPYESNGYGFLSNKRYRELREQLEAAHSSAHLHIRYEGRLTVVREAHTAWLVTDEAEGQAHLDTLYLYLHALRNTHSDDRVRIASEMGLPADVALDTFNALLQERLASLLRRVVVTAETADALTALNQANELIRFTQKGVHEYWDYDFGSPEDANGKYFNVGATPLERPGNWNDLVVRTVPDPKLTLFDTKQHLATGEALRLAAEALADNDLLKIAVMLAHLNQEDTDRRKQVRSEVPGELVAALATQAVRLRRETTPATT